MHELASSRIVTLRQVLDDYIRVKRLRVRTEKNYKVRIETHLSDWLDEPVSVITKKMVEERHRVITARGKSIANDVFRTLRSLLKFAQWYYEDDCGESVLKVNPVNRLNEIRAWHKIKPRQGVIEPLQLRAWFRAVFSLDNSTVRDYLILVICTGLRKGEAQHLTWEQCDLDGGVLRLDPEDTKTDTQLTVPLSRYVWGMLIQRKIGAMSHYVFPGLNKTKPISLGTKTLDVVRERCGVHFTLHDLRRSFSTYADDLEIKNELVDELTNHVPQTITERHYIVRNVERLRRCTEQITGYILKHAGVSPGTFIDPRPIAMFKK